MFGWLIRWFIDRNEFEKILADYADECIRNTALQNALVKVTQEADENIRVAVHTLTAAVLSQGGKLVISEEANKKACSGKVRLNNAVVGENGEMILTVEEVKNENS